MIRTTATVICIIVTLGCASRSHVVTETVNAADGKWEYIQTSKNGIIISRYVDTCDESGMMISRLYLDGEMRVMYYDEYNNGLPAIRYRQNGELWMDFTDREGSEMKYPGISGSREVAKSKAEVADAVEMATRIAIEAIKYIK